MGTTVLKAPQHLEINFKPSEKQYELWQMLQPNRCNLCGSTIGNKYVGLDSMNKPIHKPTCSKCGNQNIPQMILGGGAAGGGKAMSLNSHILTPNGFKPLTEAQVGDEIIDPTTGKTQHITFIHEKGEWEFFRISFEDGTSAECSEGHLWHICEFNKEVEARKIYSLFHSQGFDGAISIPITRPIKAIQKESTSHNFASFNDRVTYIKELLKRGSYDLYTDRSVMCRVDDNEACSAIDVLRSLGCKAMAVDSLRGCNLCFWMPKDVDVLPNNALKKYIRGSFYSTQLTKRIVGIEAIGKQKSFCITVSGRHGLYVTDDYTVTHNSYLASCWVVSSCLRFPDIRAAVGRKTLKSLKESTFNTIKKVCRDWGLKEYEHFKINNLDNTLTFWNDSVIILKEMAFQPSDPDYSRFGSSEFTIAVVDEASECEERAIEVLFSRLRWRTHETFMVPKMLLTTNPSVNWIRPRFVQDDDGNPVECREGEAYCPFSVFDNPDDNFRQLYRASLDKITDRATKERLLFGNWDFVDSNDLAAYYRFDGEKHLVSNLKEKHYDPMRPIIISWDFNVSPYMSTIALQVNYDTKEIFVLEEILGYPEDKENNTPRMAKKLREKYSREGHIGGIIITGDPAGKARSTQTEEGVNNYTIIAANMSESASRVEQRLFDKQPPQTMRLDFVNALFDGFDGWTVKIDLRCRKLTEDMIYQKKNADGTKNKKKQLDPKTGVKYERYGHLSDCLDYALCLFINDSWRKFNRKGTPSITTTSHIPTPLFDY